MYPLKLSTAITVPFFSHDVNGDGVTGIADGSFTKRISKNGGAFAAMTVTITEMENGWYSLPISTSHTDTLGILSISISAAAAKRANLQFRIDTRVPDDLAYPTISGRSLDVSAGGEAGIDWANIGSPTTAQNLSATNIDVDQIIASVSGAVGSVAAGGITATSIATGAIDADALATDAVAEIADGVWDEDATAHQTQGSFGQVLGDSGADADTVWALVNTNLDATISSRASAAALTTVQADTDDIQTRLPAALVGGRIDSSVGAMAADVVTATAIAADAIGASELATDAAAEIADAVLDEVIEGTRTLRQILRGFSSALLSKLSGAATATNTFRDIDDTKARITATVDADGNRTAITLDLT